MPRKGQTPRLRADGKIKCSACKRWKVRHLYHKMNNVVGAQSQCICCDLKRQGTDLRRVQKRRAKTLAQYNLTEDDYQKLSETQEHKCAICFVERTNVRFGRLHVDHSHLTGQIRGLLCGRCNKAIGLLGDDPANARQASIYLTQETL